jgi:hypothetical protein
MSSEVLSFTVTAGQTTVAGQGRIFNLLSAPGGPVSIVADTRKVQGGQSPQRIFNNIPAGSKFVAKDGEGWTYLRITSPVTQVITLFVGDDDMQFNNAVTVTGTAATTVQPSATITATVAPTVVATGASSTVAANASRRRITIAAAVANTGYIYVQSVGAAVNLGGVPIGPGQFVEFDTNAGLDVRNSTGANQSYSTFEES